MLAVIARSALNNVAQLFSKFWSTVSNTVSSSDRQQQQQHQQQKQHRKFRQSITIHSKAMSPPKKEVYVVAAKRTPIGSFQGALSSLDATELGAIAIRACLESVGIRGDQVDEVIFGNVLQANEGQAPARQAALKAGLSKSVPCTTINKICASGMKAISMATQSILLGDADVVVCGGMESMSNVPYYMPREAPRFGNLTMVDGVVKDGLTDSFDKLHMGNCTENLAKQYGITREETDEFAKQSYLRAMNAIDSGVLAKEITPVVISGGKGKSEITVSEDEEIRKVKFEKLPYLNSCFQKDGTITAANASSINDGAAACILMSESAVQNFGLKPLAKVVGYADYALEPIDFGIAPAFAIEKLLQKYGVQKNEVSHWELNEAFSTVGIANTRKLALDPSKVNPNGGAVGIGHPLGCSGARITNALVHHLRTNEIGCAAICNGGGGASAILIQKM